jgi:hypothetical protein
MTALQGGLQTEVNPSPREFIMLLQKTENRLSESGFTLVDVVDQDDWWAYHHIRRTFCSMPEAFPTTMPIVRTNILRQTIRCC